jgi:hypothetical protein
MASGAQRSEYIFEVDVGTFIRAQNTLLTSLGASLDDRDTWATANYAWNSPAANRQWTYDGAVKNIEARFQIAREDFLQEGELYGWRLNGVLTGFGSPTVSESAGVSYDDGRYGDGVAVKDTTRVSWAVSIPTVFHTSFWFIPDEVTTSIIWTVTGSGISLSVGYDAAEQEFFLEDHLSRRVIVPYAVAVEDRVCIGVCQTATDRRLFIGKMGGDVESASASIAAAGAYTSLRLY